MFFGRVSDFSEGKPLFFRSPLPEPPKQIWLRKGSNWQQALSLLSAGAGSALVGTAIVSLAGASEWEKSLGLLYPPWKLFSYFCLHKTQEDI